MKKMMKVCAWALIGGAFLTGCASTSLTPEQEAEVGGWRDEAQMMLDAKDPDLTAACNSGIAEVDVIANTVTPIATEVNGLINTKIREEIAALAWLDYDSWMNGPEAGKLTGEALKKESARQALWACYEAGLMLNSADPEADAIKVWNKRQTSVLNAEAVNELLKTNVTPEMKTWASALIANHGKGRDAFYEAIGVNQKVDWTKVVLPALATYTATLTEQNTRIAEALKNPELMAKLNPLTGSKETIAAVDRLRKQITVTATQIPWLIDAIQHSEE